MTTTLANKLIKGISAAFIASAAALTGIISASAYDIERHSQAEIKEMYKKLYFDTHNISVYTEPYSTSYPGTPGKVSDDTLEEGLNSINFCRYLAGLPYDVELDDSYNSAAQHASLIIYMNNSLSHHPSKPANMGSDVYSIAYKASGESNIGKGYLDIQATVVQGYMYDTDPTNLSALGHRRWILNPDMQKTGLGMVYDSTAMYVRDKSREEKFTGDYISWPPANMPYELIDTSESGYAYSVTLGSSYDQPDRNKVKVTLTSKKLGKTFTFDKNSGKNVNNPVGYFNVNTENMGIHNCIIFNPGALPENDVVEVKITGIYKKGIETPITYKVNYFNMLNANDYTIKFPQKKYEIEVGEMLILRGYDNPISNNGLCFWHYCDDDDTNDLSKYMDILRSGGTAMITAKSEGVIDFWLGDKDTWFDDVYTTVKITHKHQRGGWIIDQVPTETTEGKRHHQCSLCGKNIDYEIMPPTTVNAAEIHFDSDNYTFMGTAVTPKIKVYAGSTRLTEGTDYVVSYANNGAPGTATVTIKGIGSFSGSRTVEFEIAKRDPVEINKMNIEFNKESVIYTGSPIEPKLTIKEGSYTLVRDKDYTAVYKNNISVGKATLTITGMGDYKGTASYSFNITPADIGFPWTSEKLSDVKYSGKLIMLKLDLTSQVSGEQLVQDEDYTVSYRNNFEIGTAEIEIKGIGNYTGSTKQTFEIVSPEDYNGPEERDDVIEVETNAAVVLKNDVKDTEIIFVSIEGMVYKVMAVSGDTFYADLPEGDYTVWVIKKYCMPVRLEMTVGQVFSTIDAEVYQYGDINQDGIISVTDTAMSAAFTKGIRAPANDQQRQLADVTRDGILNVTDTSKIAAHTKGIKVLKVEEEFEIPAAQEKDETEDSETSSTETEESAEN